MRPSSITSSWALLLIFTVTIVESNAIPLTMRRRSFEDPSLLASHAFRHAFVSSRMHGLLPRNHRSQYEGHGLRYDGGEHRGEGNRYDQERQQEDRYDEGEEDAEDIGMSRGDHRSGSEPADPDNATDGTHDSFREDEHVRPHAIDSPEDSAVGNFHYDPPYAPTNEAGPEHKHSTSASPQDTSEADDVSTSSPHHPVGEKSSGPDPAPHQGQEPSPDEITPAQQVVSSSFSNEGTPSTVCSALSRLYEQLDGPAWRNHEGWKDITTHHRIRIRDHEASSESQRPFRTSSQTEDDSIGGHDEDHGDEDRIDRGTTSNRNEDPVVVNEGDDGLSCCSWFGVICRGSRVVGLDLARNGLNGPYPADAVQHMVDLETV